MNKNFENRTLQTVIISYFRPNKDYIKITHIGNIYPNYRFATLYYII